MRQSGACYEALKEEWGGAVCETIIHGDNLIERYGEQWQPIRLYAHNSPAASLYSDLADELTARLSLPEAQSESRPPANQDVA
jgi:cellulose biosynthesis protein BcsQ